MTKINAIQQIRLLVFVITIVLSTFSAFAYNITGTVTGNGTLEFYKITPNATDSITTTVFNKLSAMVPVNNSTVLNPGDTIVVYANPALSSRISSFNIGGKTFSSSPATIVVANEDIAASASFVDGTVLYSETFGSYIGTAYFGISTSPTFATAFADKTFTFDNSNTTVNYSLGGGFSRFFNQSAADTNIDPKAACLSTQGNNNFFQIIPISPITGSEMQLKFRINPNTTSSVTTYLLALDGALILKVNDTQLTVPILNNTDITYFRKNLTRPLVNKYAFECPYIVIPLSVNSVNKIEIRSFSLTGKLNRFTIDDVSVVGSGNSSGIDQISGKSEIITIIDGKNITLKGEMKLGSTVNVYNLSGLEVMKTIVNNEQLRISFEKYQSGMYIVSIQNNNGILQNIKVVI